MLKAGTAYHCYCTKQELDALREAQIARKEKPRYAGICRARTAPRADVAPVIRFRNPLDGAVVVEDLVHGAVTFQNAELDDLIIARSDGTPTYNFCVVVDDMFGVNPPICFSCTLNGYDAGTYDLPGAFWNVRATYKF